MGGQNTVLKINLQNSIFFFFLVWNASLEVCIGQVGRCFSTQPNLVSHGQFFSQILYM